MLFWKKEGSSFVFTAVTWSPLLFESNFSNFPDSSALGVLKASQVFRGGTPIKKDVVFLVPFRSYKQRFGIYWYLRRSTAGAFVVPFRMDIAPKQVRQEMVDNQLYD